MAGGRNPDSFEQIVAHWYDPFPEGTMAPPVELKTTSEHKLDATRLEIPERVQDIEHKAQRSRAWSRPLIRLIAMFTVATVASGVLGAVVINRRESHPENPAATALGPAVQTALGNPIALRKTGSCALEMEVAADQQAAHPTPGYPNPAAFRAAAELARDNNVPCLPPEADQVFTVPREDGTVVSLTGDAIVGHDYNIDNVCHDRGLQVAVNEQIQDMRGVGQASQRQHLQAFLDLAVQGC